MMITGQVILREAGDAPTHDGRKLMMIVGIIAVPGGYEFRGEHQYTISGDLGGNMRLHLSSERNVSDLTETQDLGNLVTLPIWRC